MKGASVLFFLGLCIGWSQGIFLNHGPFPTYSLENMPKTSFSCRDKILGGYYADADTQCQMFHICVKVAGIGVQDFRFLCPNGTAFDQDHQICADWDDIDCDATTLYYSSDNFDLYRLGSGFESKAVKYGEEEEPFVLQRAETGDARINREQQTRVVDQTKAPRNYKTARKNNNNNNDKEIFKSSSSSNFYNNRNNGKERDEDYDDNVNINQNQDFEQKRKVVRNKIRRPTQNNQNYNRNNQNDYNNRNNQNNNRNNQRTQPNNDFNRNTNYNRNQNNDNNYNRNQNNENNYNRNQNNDNNNNRNQNNDNNYNTNQNNDNNYNRNQNNENNYNRNQNNDNNYNRNQNNDNNYNRNQNNDNNYNRNQNNDNNYNNENNYNRNQNNDYNTDNTKSTLQPVQQTRLPSTKFTGFVNNFAGSYEPTTSKPSSTTLNTEQYTTAVNNYENRISQRPRPQTKATDSPVYTISTPAPFKSQQQQYNFASVKNNNNNVQFQSTTAVPQKITENYPKKSTIYNDQYDIPKIRQNTQTTQNYNTHYDIPKTKAVSSTNGQYNTQYDSLKTTVGQYETTKTKSTFNYPKTTVSEKTENYPSNNPKYSTFDKKQTTPYKQNDNYPTTLKPRPFSTNINNNFPTTFAPRTNAGYSQIAQQTTSYNQNRNSANTGSNGFSSTPRSTPFTQYTPTVPKLSSTTPVSRSSRFDETQYDDGSYSSKYDYDGDRRDDEFLKTAHSQNIAASRNELSRTTKQQPITPQKSTPQQKSTSSFSQQPQRTTYDVPKTTPPQISTPQQKSFSQQPQRTTYDVPKTFASTPNASKSTEPPKFTQPEKKLPVSTKKTKDVSYDYAYYDSNVGSEPDYEIDTEIKKSTVKN